MRADLLLLAADLVRRGEPFALATVVRRQAPSSAREGDTALITTGGTCHGWVGGTCTQSGVIHEALRALRDGTPRLVVFSADPDVIARTDEIVVPMTCESGGAVEIHIEPVVPAPRLVVFGISPVAQATARIAKAAGYSVDAVDPGADRATFPEADRVITDAAALEPTLPTPYRGDRTFAIVATMGRWDAEATLAAIALEPAYLGLVASQRRFTELRDALRAKGISADAIKRIKNPAGLDIGARTPEEIALSILAEIVRLGRAGQRMPVAGLEIAEPGERDPVCGMAVVAGTAKHSAEFAGRTYYFCCGSCRERFLAAPDRYAIAEAGDTR
jgi:xanthine dehydrogenase accessory factor